MRNDATRPKTLARKTLKIIASITTNTFGALVPFSLLAHNVTSRNIRATMSSLGAGRLEEGAALLLHLWSKPAASQVVRDLQHTFGEARRRSRREVPCHRGAGDGELSASTELLSAFARSNFFTEPGWTKTSRTGLPRKILLISEDVNAKRVTEKPD